MVFPSWGTGIHHYHTSVSCCFSISLLPGTNLI
jgi:hypothetical protein